MRQIDRELRRLPLLCILTVHDQIGLVVVGDGRVVRVEGVGCGTTHNRGLELDELDALHLGVVHRGDADLDPGLTRCKSEVAGDRRPLLGDTVEVFERCGGVHAWRGSVHRVSPRQQLQPDGDGGGRRLGQVDVELAGLAFNRVLAEHDQEGQGSWRHRRGGLSGDQGALIGQ